MNASSGVNDSDSCLVRSSAATLTSRNRQIRDRERLLSQQKPSPLIICHTSVMLDRFWTKMSIMIFSDSYILFLNSRSNDVASWLSVTDPYPLISIWGLTYTWRSSLIPRYGSTWTCRRHFFVKKTIKIRSFYSTVSIRDYPNIPTHTHILQSELTSHGTNDLSKSFRSGMWYIFAANINMPVDNTKIDLWHAGDNTPA